MSEWLQRLRRAWHELAHDGIVLERRNDKGETVPGLLRYVCVCGVVLGDTTGPTCEATPPVVKRARKRRRSARIVPMDRKRA